MGSRWERAQAAPKGDGLPYLAWFSGCQQPDCDKPCISCDSPNVFSLRSLPVPALVLHPFRLLLRIINGLTTVWFVFLTRSCYIPVMFRLCSLSVPDGLYLCGYLLLRRKSERGGDPSCCCDSVSLSGGGRGMDRRWCSLREKVTSSGSKKISNLPQIHKIDFKAP